MFVLLRCGQFAVLCWFRVYSRVTQLYVYTFVFIFFFIIGSYSIE